MCCYLSAVIVVAHFLQSISPQLVLGGELVYHRGRAEEGGILTLAGQYSGLDDLDYGWIDLQIIWLQCVKQAQQEFTFDSRNRHNKLT